ncbi:MAG: methylated-DNA--[protein]-cysteine S-methyltransferase [Thiocapsa sp.]|nr:methylated-DNA--[protein]-cysteine S-methyltransferase [Thiocapsa sp.]MCG6898252.1 methylated-DNA--[protein]-cysteine S-methyltransferase [Thiocapsa sp.]MCG6984394.1 methylated-DNA--[protein]-cysteine S-methyltransferase [Thiocapsa sp.]
MPQTLIDTPFGPIGIRWLGETLTGVDLDPPVERAEGGYATVPPSIQRQFSAYFEDRSGFDLAVALAGTAFQERVWDELRRIPPGKTRTYGEIAGLLRSSPRAVGQACRANPCPIVVPCHRVVASRGLGGFSGDSSGRKLAVKRWLLRHEGVADLSTASRATTKF